jgi:NAD(P)-dependent dehydrogenase (short-subunit alcohol dehydrogenase family)
MKKSILVTGTSSGFGNLIVRTLAKDGHTVFASMRGVNGKNSKAAKELEQWSKEYKHDLHILELDVTDEKSVNEAVKKAVEKAGKIDVLVNNAGIGVTGILETVTIEQAQHQFNVNVFGVLRVNRAVLPYMRKQKSGLIIHISSGLGRVVLPYMGIYTASKFALEAIGETLSYELKPLGIESVIIQPGAYPTDFSQHATFAADVKRLEEYGEVKERQDKMFGSFGEMFKNAGHPQEIADVVKKYVDMQPGKRPLRINKGLMSDGAAVINEVCEKVEKEALQHMS